MNIIYISVKTDRTPYLHSDGDIVTSKPAETKLTSDDEKLYTENMHHEQASP